MKPKPPHICPDCGHQMATVIYYGLPHRLCWDEGCGCLLGWPTVLTYRLPFNGMFMTYPRGLLGYLRGLWIWLKGDAT